MSLTGSALRLGMISLHVRILLRTVSGEAIRASWRICTPREHKSFRGDTADPSKRDLSAYDQPHTSRDVGSTVPRYSVQDKLGGTHGNATDLSGGYSYFKPRDGGTEHASSGGRYDY